jgi:hypothetical protein
MHVRLQDLPEYARDFVAHMRATSTPKYAETVQTYVSRFEVERTQRQLDYPDAFALRDRLFATMSQGTRKAAIVATNAYMRWLSSKIALGDNGPSMLLSSGAPSRTAVPSAPSTDSALAMRLAAIEEMLASRLAAIERAVSNVVPPSGGDIPYARTQFERIVASVGLEEAAALLDVDDGTLRNALRRRDTVPHHDPARLDEVYVAIRAADMDLESSELAEQVAEAKGRARARGLDRIVEGQRGSA